MIDAGGKYAAVAASWIITFVVSVVIYVRLAIKGEKKDDTTDSSK